MIIAMIVVVEVVMVVVVAVVMVAVVTVGVVVSGCCWKQLVKESSNINSYPVSDVFVFVPY